MPLGLEKKEGAVLKFLGIFHTYKLNYSYGEGFVFNNSLLFLVFVIGPFDTI